MNRPEIYRQVAVLHAKSIDQGFLATLGTRFMTMLYEALDSSRQHVLLIEEREGRIAGFVAGGSGMSSIYKRMLRQPFRLGASLLPSLFRLPRIVRILEVLKYGRATGEALPEAELLSIAVEPEFRGQGVAESLYLRLMEHFRAEGRESFKITVGEDLAPAHRFYTRMGAKPACRIQVHRGEISIVYVHRMA